MSVPNISAKMDNFLALQLNFHPPAPGSSVRYIRLDLAAIISTYMTQNINLGSGAVCDPLITPLRQVVPDTSPGSPYFLSPDQDHDSDFIFLVCSKITYNFRVPAIVSFNLETLLLYKGSLLQPCFLSHFALPRNSDTVFVAFLRLDGVIPHEILNFLLTLRAKLTLLVWIVVANLATYAMRVTFWLGRLELLPHFVIGPYAFTIWISSIGPNLLAFPSRLMMTLKSERVILLFHTFDDNYATYPPL